MKGFYFLLVCLIAFSVGVYGQEELTIDDIIDMVQAGLSDSFILQKIRISTLEYPPNVEDLVELRRAGVSERIILALMGVGSRGRLSSASQTRYAYEDMPHPDYELFGGYSYGLLEGQVDVHGWNITGTNHFNNWFGLTFDGGGYYSGGFSQSMYTFFAGPQFSFRFTQKVTPYIRALGGGAWVRPGLLGVVTGSELGYAYGAGGGVDVKINEQIAVRAAQVDFIRIHVLGVGSDQVRASFGIVGRW